MATIGQGLLVAGQAIGQGIRDYYGKQEEKRQEQAALSFMKANAAKFGLPDDEAALKAGIKAAGGASQLMQIFGQAQQEARAKAQEARAAEYLQMQKEQLEFNQGSQMADRGAARLAVGAAPARPELGAMLQRGGTFQSTMPQQGGDAVTKYFAAGGTDPQMARVLQQQSAARGMAEPSIFTAPGGKQFAMFGNNQVLPAGTDPAALSSKEFQKPIVSADGKFYRGGPDQPWKPVPATGTRGSQLSPTQIASYRKSIDELNAQIVEHQNAKAAGDERHGLANWRNRETTIAQLTAQRNYFEDLLNYGGFAGEPEAEDDEQVTIDESAQRSLGSIMTRDQFYSDTN